MRNERKFEFKKYQLNQIRSYLLLENFNEHYPQRIVNSVYYDDFNFDSFAVSEAGYLNRSKQRVRWYDNSKSSHLEIKKKYGETGKKEINIYSKNNCHSLSFHCPFSKNKYLLLIPKSISNKYFPKLIISYKRYYFYNIEKDIRITLDFDIKTSLLKKYNFQINTSNWFEFQDCVLEVKYLANDKCEKSQVYLINSISKQFNLLLSRHSKYCNSVALLY